MTKFEIRRNKLIASVSIVLVLFVFLVNSISYASDYGKTDAEEGSYEWAYYIKTNWKKWAPPNSKNVYYYDSTKVTFDTYGAPHFKSDEYTMQELMNDKYKVSNIDSIVEKGEDKSGKNSQNSATKSEDGKTINYSEYDKEHNLSEKTANELTDEEADYVYKNWYKVSDSYGGSSYYPIEITSPSQMYAYSNMHSFDAKTIDEKAARVASENVGVEPQTEESTEEDDDTGNGGILMSPFIAFVNAIADGIASGLQKFMVNGGLVMKTSVSDAAKTNSTDADITIKKDYGIGTLYPNFTYSCEEIFANKVPWLDINFLNPSIKNSDGNLNSNIAYKLQDIIKAWYRVLRLIAIVGLLSILIYTGIKIMIESNTEKRAKYKERIVDWLVAFVILFAMNYIMSFTLAISSELTDLFTGPSDDTANIVVYYEPSNTYFKTNLIGLARFKVQNDSLSSKIGYEIVYIALLVFTMRFTVEYFKRVIMMAFLTLISPIVALTYPIDKMGDGNAQGFQKWLREYIFNALLQPMHYLIYTILIGSAITLAANNPIYPIVVLMFMAQAEKFVRDLFGFGKAGGLMEPGGRGAHAFASGAITTQLLNRIGKGNNGNKGDKNKLPTNKPPKTVPTGDIGGLPETGESTADAFANAGTVDDVVNTNNNNNTGNNNENLNAGNNNQPNTIQYDGKTYQQTPSGILLDSNTNQNVTQQQNAQTSQPIITQQQTENNQTSYQAQDFSHAFEKSNRSTALTGGQKFKKGMGAIGKKIIKPVWDTNKSAKYNLKRLGKNAAKAYVAAGLGVAAATAELGVSVTDGKFDPKEAVASVTAGAVAGNALANGAFNFGSGAVDTYNSAIYGDQYDMEKYQRQWRDNDKVDEFYGENFGDDKDINKRIASDEFLTRGITDLDEQKQALTYMDAVSQDEYTQWEESQKTEIRNNNANYDDDQVNDEFARIQAEQAKNIKKNLGFAGRKLDDEAAIKAAIKAQHANEAVTILKFRKQAEKKGALMDSDKRKNFVRQQAKARSAKLGISEVEARKQIENAFNNVDKFDAANKL